MARKMGKKGDDLTRKQIAELKAALERERQILIDSAIGTKAAERDREQLISVDEMDETNDEVMRAHEHRLRDRELGKMRKIERALQRIAEGTYNECERCGNPIGYERLRARSVTTFCITCKEEQEAAEKQVYEPPRWSNAT